MSTFLDEKAIVLVFSPTRLCHVQSWFGETVCGKYIDHRNGWTLGNLTSLRYVGRMAQRPQINKFCKGCASQYKDVNVDAD